MATPDTTYTDLDPDWFARRNNPEARKSRLLKQLAELRYQVELRPAV